MATSIFHRSLAIVTETQNLIRKPMFVFFVFCFFTMNPTIYSQAQGEVQVKKADFTGKNPSEAIYAALDASKEDVVVVLVRGGSEGLVEKTEGNMKALIRNGYNRIGLIVADLFDNEKNAVVSVFSGGSTYATIKNAEQDAYNDWAVYNLVRDAYEEDIIPKLRKGSGSND